MIKVKTPWETIKNACIYICIYIYLSARSSGLKLWKINPNWVKQETEHFSGNGSVSNTFYLVLWEAKKRKGQIDERESSYPRIFLLQMPNLGWVTKKWGSRNLTNISHMGAETQICEVQLAQDLHSARSRVRSPSLVSNPSTQRWQLSILTDALNIWTNAICLLLDTPHHGTPT